MQSKGMLQLTPSTENRCNATGQSLPAGERMKFIALSLLGCAFTLGAVAQTTSEVTVVTKSNGTTVYRVVETTRTVQAVNYRHKDGVSKVDFAGTALMPNADGEAKVRSKRGTLEVEAEFGNLTNPTAFGGEYLTYVLWAISPEGRAVNLGEVLVGGNDRSKLTATTDLQSFALIVTAEPYYAVRQPSNVVVLENVLRDDTKGTSEAVEAKYELVERGGYLPTGFTFDPLVLNANLPLEFYEARNALRIAKSEGADQYAAESYQHAVQLMQTTDAYATNSHMDKKQLIASARDAVQTAEDAREIAVKKSAEESRVNQLQASSDAQASSQADAANATQLAEQSRRDTLKAQADRDKAQAEMATNQVASADAVAAAQSERDKARLETDQVRDSANQAAIQSDSDKAAIRAQLSLQLNTILETRDSARGLIVSMSDVLFDTGQYSLKPGAREKLSKVAGILLAYPSLNIQVGGYTDNVGGDDMNQKLSENRANSVRDYLVQQGVSANSITAAGFGNTLPVATNDNSTGRQENRRVELVVSGDAIGNKFIASTGSLN
jgi:outer membrane protein OmpA-like peptidoglycan-associated protein